jgi:xylulokinase
VFFGLSAIHQKPHMGRAVMEGVAYSLYDLLEVFRSSGAACDDMLLCGGGAKSPFWTKMFADVYGIDVKTGASGESACLGAAILAGCAAGVYATVQDGCDATVQTGRSYTANAENHQAYMKFYRIFRSLYPTLRESFDTLNDL